MSEPFIAKIRAADLDKIVEDTGIKRDRLLAIKAGKAKPTEEELRLIRSKVRDL